MLKSGVYPAAVTPFDVKGNVDLSAMAKLLAWFEAAGCTGAILAGTNGEGPSLSATEKRDLIAEASRMRGRLDLILGIATPSLDEAAWLCRRAGESGAASALVMPPFYFRDAEEGGIESWFMKLLDGSPIPIIVYNFPQKTGITIGRELLRRLGSHPKMAGVKDSSGNAENITPFREVLTRADQSLFVGDETLLLDALDSGWSGTISGAANVVGLPLSSIVADQLSGDRESARAKFEILLPVLQAIRSKKQPAANKAVLKEFGVIPESFVREPLTEAGAIEYLCALIRERTGLPG